MVDEVGQVSGWEPVGTEIAGARDALTGNLQPATASPHQVVVLRQLLGVVVSTVTVATLYVGKDVLIPITLAVMLAFILSPVVTFLQRGRFWRAPAVVITVLAALSIIGGIGTVIGTQAASLGVNVTQYAQAIETKVETVQESVIARFDGLTRSVGVERKEPRPPIPLVPGDTAISSVGPVSGDPLKPVLVQVTPPQTSPFEIAKTILEPVLGPLETTLIVLIVAIFILMQREDLRDRFIRVFGSGDLHRTTMALDDAGQRLSRYFLAQLAINASFGVIVTVGLWLFGIPSPALWGIFAALCRFVPYIGAILAAVGPVALGLAVDPGWSTALFIALFFVTTEAALGYIVEPLLYGHSTGLSPVSVIIAAIFWTWLWGPIGLIISTPLTLCLVVIGRHVKALEFLDVLLGDRPALTPVESFYQRVLANNADEALAQAETMLGDQDLATYYDEVVLEALKLAALDDARGTIDASRIEKMTKTMITVLEDLSGHVAPAAEENGVRPLSSGAIICLAGRGPFDDAVSVMLSQIIELRGRTSRIIAHQAVTRPEIATLDLFGATTIIISYLELNGSPAHLRFLVRRLRQKAPHARIVVGLWPEGEAALSDEAIQQTLGADDYVGSLRAAALSVEQQPPELARRPAK